MTPIFQHSFGNQQNFAKHHPIVKNSSYENFGSSDYYQSLDIENAGSGTYQMLQINNNGKDHRNETLVLNTEKSDEKNNKCANEPDIQGIVIAFS